MNVLDRTCAALAVGAVFCPIAHVLEMPNKLRLDGPLWLAVQQSLYNGWGPFIGAPTELGALAFSIVLCWQRAGEGRARLLGLLAACAYALMLIVFFVFNAPVNAAVAAWHADSLPANWASFRASWEIGHGLAAVLSCMGLIAILRALGCACGGALHNS